jgi:hypothetical protein
VEEGPCSVEPLLVLPCIQARPPSEAASSCLARTRGRAARTSRCRAWTDGWMCPRCRSRGVVVDVPAAYHVERWQGLVGTVPSIRRRRERSRRVASLSKRLPWLACRALLRQDGCVDFPICNCRQRARSRTNHTQLACVGKRHRLGPPEQRQYRAPQSPADPINGRPLRPEADLARTA